MGRILSWKLLPLLSTVHLVPGKRSRTRVLFELFSLLVVVKFREPLGELFVVGFSSELFFYVLLVPLVSAFFLYSKKDSIFSRTAPSHLTGAGLILLGSALYVAGDWSGRLSSEHLLCVMTATFLTILIGGFIFFYGLGALRKAAFPLGFLFLMVPIPSQVVTGAVATLQHGSTEVVDWTFKVAGLPATRQGHVFSLPNMAFEVAPQCSGIRSALYLFLTGLVFGQLFLDSSGTRTILAILTVPLAILKNGLRIVTLGVMGNYVNPDILSSDLHRTGGIPFMVAGVLALAVVARVLGVWERKTQPVLS